MAATLLCMVGVNSLEKESVTVLLQIGIGMGAKGTAEYTKRGENFGKELDFVFANVMMALIADFCLVWLPSPTISFR